jgi:probable rRNA maturation factor
MTDDSDHPPSPPPSRADGSVPGPTILISNRQDLPVDEDGLSALASECLVGEGFPVTELSVSFVTDEEMADLHLRYLGEDGPTDVLSFGLGESHCEERGEDAPESGGALVLGDVVIAPAYAARNARPGGGADAELRLLLVHGILHLLGHDHEADDERTAMWATQERYSGVRA